MGRAIYAVLMVSLFASAFVSVMSTHNIRVDGILAPTATMLSEATRSIALFRSLLKIDLNDIANDIPEIEGFYLENSPYFPVTVVHINYTSNLTDLEKIYVQFIVQNELEPKWYVKYVELSRYVTIPENPPPPWPGFAIGRLIVGFISQLPDPIIVPDHFPAIQLAINNASDGDTVFVRNGTYYKNVVVNKSISLIGENEGNTVISNQGECSDIISVVDAYNVIISDFTIRNCSGYHGVYVEDSENCTVEYCDFVDISEYGIYAVDSDYCKIESNNFASSEGYWGRGIQLRYSNNCTVANNRIMTHNDQYCIWLHNSSSCRIYGNTLGNASNCDGLLIEHSVDCLVKKNIIANCGRGIEIGWWVGGEFTENLIKSNYYGVEAEGFLPQYPEYPKWIFHHNNLLSNTHNVYVSSGNGSWDNGCEGNYWSNYNGTDLDGDGIGDTYLPWEGLDSYPLMNLYWDPGDIDHDMDVDIFDIVRCAGAYGSTPSSPIWNPHCDIAEPYGIVNIFDLVMIATSYGEEYTP